ncbi:MAG: phage baseplate assembly protein V [Marinobacterium sp.]|nr:phage baseplate assembly protein V [Marinobacterium sp.]
MSVFDKEYRAQVISTEDPEQLLRVQVRIPGLWDAVPKKDLPWAEYKFNDARYRGGEFNPAELDDWVWVDFINGDSRYPRITGWCHFAPGGKPDTPHEAWVGPEKIVHKLDQVIGEPKPVDPVYHGSQVLEKFGLIQEINPDGELLITQRETGTAFRFTKEGAIHLHCEEVLYHSSVKDTTGHVGRDWLSQTDRNLHFKIAQNCTFDIGGNLTFNVGGTVDVISGGVQTYIAPHIDLNP